MVSPVKPPVPASQIPVAPVIFVVAFVIIGVAAFAVLRKVRKKA